MRYTMCLIGLFLMSAICPASAEVARGPSDGPVMTGSTGNLDALRIRLAQVNVEESTIELAEPSGGDANIFEHLQIELLDLEKMGREIVERLVGEPIELTLEDCVQMALKANQDILISGYDPLISEADLQAAKGEFDPALTAQITVRDSTTPLSPIQKLFFPAGDSVFEQRFTNYELSVGGRLFWGTQYNVGFTGDRDKGTSTVLRDPFSGNIIDTASVYGGDFTLRLTQPILRGFGGDSNRVRIRSARKALGISAAQLELTVLTSVGQVIKGYWDLVGAVEQLGVRRESFANAMRLVEINEQRLNIGTAAAIEVLGAKAGAAGRQSDLVIARAAILDTEVLLKDLIGLYEDDLLSSNSLVPISRPSPVEVDWDREESMRAALENRPEIRSAELQVENAQLELASARDALLPQLDAIGSYGRNDRTFDFDDTFRGVADGNGDGWSIGVIGSIPIGNRSARGAHKRARLFVKQQEQRLRQAKRQAMLGVNLALHGLVANEILIESNKQTRILQEANVAAEEKRLQLGVTTSQQVLDIQEDLTTAQAQEIQSQIDFEKSLIDLQVAEGTLLENLGIIYEPTGDVDPLGFFHSINPVRGFR